MSEKRFELEISSFSGKHMKFLNILDNGKRLNSEEIVDLLNEQQATINRLQSDLKDYNEIKENWDDMVELATKTSLRNVELDEQIGQLRKELNDCEKFRYTVFKRLNDEYIKERSIR